MKPASYAQLIYTLDGITKENIFKNSEKVLHIGAGKRPLQGVTNVDIIELPEVDVVHDLDKMPWPFPDSSFDVIFAHSVFEHLEDILSVMKEMSRILKPGGRVIIAVPYFRSIDAYMDPTHEHFFTARTLDYFCTDGGNLFNFQYTNVVFKKVGFWFNWPHQPKNPVRKFFKKVLHGNISLYEKYFSLLFPAKILIWELEVVK